MGQCKSVVEILPATTKILTEQAKVCFELTVRTLQRLYTSLEKHLIFASISINLKKLYEFKCPE